MSYFPTIGLEIHAELLTQSKVFCTCAANFGGEENTRCCPVCSGMPGTLPVLNEKAVEYIIKAGLITGCDIAGYAKWDRKNYFYPDLPKAYQISQMPRPVCTNGAVDIESNDTAEGKRRVRINRIHLEEDAGKLVHEGGLSLADYNRCGVPLIEIVTEPDMHTAEEAAAFLEKIRLLLVYAGVCDGRMEQGSLRCDVNISLAPEGSPVLGTRAELKNLNSMRSVVKATQYEIYRQTEILSSGGIVKQETRRFSDSTGETSPLRSKEDAHDYRYFPDPDICPLIITKEDIARIADELPELPDSRLERYISAGLSLSQAKIIVAERRLSDFFDQVCKHYPKPKTVAPYVLTELMYHLNLTTGDNADSGVSKITLGEQIETLPFTAEQFARLIDITDNGKINRANLKEILRIMCDVSGAGASHDPSVICEQNGFFIKEDLSLAESVIDEILAANPKAVEQYKNGEKKVFGFLMGQANKRLKDAAAPAAIKQLLESKLI
jgi:aspartyl-tRNA(Asn)/glutamyl-tRNA(Gln) amidotransferase subunit B